MSHDLLQAAKQTRGTNPEGAHWRFPGDLVNLRKLRVLLSKQLLMFRFANRFDCSFGVFQ